MIEIEMGWITKEGKEPREQTLSAGVLSQMLSGDYTTQLEYNLMSGEAELNRQPIPTSFIDNFYVYLSERGWKIQKGHAIDALQTAAQKNSYHPVVDEFIRIELDDSIQPIDLDQVATDYLGTNDHLYDEMLATTLVGLVNRTFHNGCKFDTCLVLTGSEGKLKSTFWKELATDNWFCDTWQSKQQDLFMAINQCLIYELAELDGITSAKAQASLKAVFSSATDTYKRPYARGIGKFPRPSILVATSNRCDFLSDPSASHRRFWVIPVKKEIDTEKVKQDRKRILKAAILAYRNGRKPYLKKELQDESNRRNKNFQAEHPFMEKLSAWVVSEFSFSGRDALIGSGLRQEENISGRDLKEVSNCLKALGFEKDDGQTRVNGTKKYLYRRPKTPKTTKT
jgi:predicted P-loop ATPase